MATVPATQLGSLYVDAPTLTFAENRPVEKTALTPEEQAALLAQIAAQQPVTQQPAEASALQKGIGALETGATLASSGPAYLVGLANLLGTLTPPEARTMGIMGAPQIQPGQYERPVTPDFREALDRYRSTVEALTYMPRTEEGQRQLGAVGEFLEPLSYVPKQIGAGTEFLTGSPLAGEYAEEFGLDVLGLGIGKLANFGGIGARIPDSKAEKRPSFFSKVYDRFFGGSQTKGAKRIKDLVDKLIGEGLEGQELWDAQAGQPFRGYYDPSDGKFRIEFDTSKTDFKAKLDTNEYLDPDKTYYGPSVTKKLFLEDVLDFPEIFEAYPQFREIKVEPVPFGMNLQYNGLYDETTKTMYLAPKENKQQILSTTLHELQHAIQAEEDFLRGSNPDIFLPDNFLEYEKEVKARKETLENQIDTEIAASLDISDLEDLPLGVTEGISSISQLLQEQKNVPDILRDVEELSQITDSSRIKQLKSEIKRKLGFEFGKRQGTRLQPGDLSGVNVDVYDLELLMENFDNDINAILQVSEKVRPVVPLYQKAKKEYFENMFTRRSARQQYRATPGEVEAVNVQDRFDSPEGKSIYPPFTARRSPEKMIYPVDPRFRPRSQSMSASYDPAYKSKIGRDAAKRQLALDLDKTNLQQLEGFGYDYDLSDFDIKDFEGMSPAGKRLIRALAKEDFLGYEKLDELLVDIFDVGIEDYPDISPGLKQAFGRYLNEISGYDLAEKAIDRYAMGGGVASMAPVATNMFQGYDIRRGVGAYAPYTRRA